MTTPSHLRAAMAVVAFVLTLPALSHAQNGELALAMATEGDCVVTLRNVPTGARVEEIAVYVDNTLLTVEPARRAGRDARLRLKDPLHENSLLAASLTVGGTKVTTVVQQAPQEHGPRNGRCDRVELRDDREVFEASGYLGRAFDNFSPGTDTRRAPTKPGPGSRWLAGVESQYRLLGGKRDARQVWLAAYTMHGVRSADVDCESPQFAALCGGTQREKFFAIFENASSLEAHFDLRVEFLALQRESETPIKAFAVARFGFVTLNRDVEADDGTTVNVSVPKVLNSDMLGVGILSPAGPFKGSNASVGWGLSDRFQSHPGWNRLKVNGTLIFDVMPGFKDRLQFWKRMAGAPRVFVSMSVDRNPGGPAPDSVTSYIGVDVDLRRIFFGLGG
jgi:hypothetical protein